MWFRSWGWSPHEWDLLFSRSVMSNSLHPMAACQALLSFTVSQSLLKLMSVMPSNHLSLCHSLLLLSSVFSSIRVSSNESALRIRWPKCWSFSFSISPSSEYSGLIFFRVDWFDLLAVQGTLSSLLQHHSWRASILQHSAFFMVQLSYPYMTTIETIALTISTFVGKVISLRFKTPSRFVIAFLPRSKCLLISWLQSPSAVILEAKIIRVKDTSGNSPARSSMWRHSQEMAVYEPGRWLPPHIESAGALSWIPQSPEPLEIYVCCL